MDGFEGYPLRFELLGFCICASDLRPIHRHPGCAFLELPQEVSFFMAGALLGGSNVSEAAWVNPVYISGNFTDPVGGQLILGQQILEVPPQLLLGSCCSGS